MGTESAGIKDNGKVEKRKNISDDSVLQTGLGKKKKVKGAENMAINPDVNIIQSLCENTEVVKKKKKTENIIINPDNCENTGVAEKKKKKRNGSIIINTDSGIVDTCENTEVVKKKKKTENIKIN